MRVHAVLVSLLPVLVSEPAKPVSQKAPEGFVEMKVGGVFTTENGPAVFLQDQDEATILPIWIGGTEAMSIQLRFERKSFQRPLTHDLLDRIMHELGGELVKVHVDDLKGSTFVGTVFVKSNGSVREIDARPSDSIALALGNRVPIYVSRKVLDRAGVKKDSLPPFPDDSEEPGIKRAPDLDKRPAGGRTDVHEL